MNNLTFVGNPWDLLEDALSFRRPVHSWVRAFANRVEGRFPPINCFANAHGVVLDIELPGKTSSDIDIKLQPLAITIAVKGNEEGRNFERRFELKYPVDTDKAKSALKNGILRIELPKVEAAAPRQLAIAEG